MPRLTIERLREAIRYEPDTGDIYRKEVKFKSRVNHGEPVRNKNNEGYYVIYVDEVKIRAHRAAWAVHYGEWPNGDVDHINRNRSDNRIENLRIATKAQNQMNSVKNNQLGRKGVRIKESGNYAARIRDKSKHIYLGTYPTLDEAAHAYNKAAIKYHGEFAVLNPIGVDYE